MSLVSFVVLFIVEFFAPVASPLFFLWSSRLSSIVALRSFLICRLSSLSSVVLSTLLLSYLRSFFDCGVLEFFDFRDVGLQELTRLKPQFHIEVLNMSNENRRIRKDIHFKFTNFKFQICIDLH